MLRRGARPERNIMAKREEKESRAQPNQRLPKDHFDSDGKSQGKQEGPVRPGWDAYQTKESERK